jgi:hypothetical protein
MLGLHEQIGGTKLVDAERLLELVWDQARRPSLRWLRAQTYRRMIPSHPVGRLVFYDPDEVRRALLTISYSTRRPHHPAANVKKGIVAKRQSDQSLVRGVIPTVFVRVEPSRYPAPPTPALVVSREQHVVRVCSDFRLPTINGVARIGR